MISRFIFTLALSSFLAAGSGLHAAATFSTLTGETLEGEPVNYDPKGVVIQRSIGGFTPRIAWTNFTQESLKALAKDPKARPLAESYLDMEFNEAEEAKKTSPDIVIKPVPRPPRPDLKAGLGSLFSSPLSLAIFVVLWLGGIYAGYEIAIFRNQQPALVCGLAAVAPVIAPVVFLCMPTRLLKSQDEIASESMAQHQATHGHAGHGTRHAPGPAPIYTQTQSHGEAGQSSAPDAAAEAAPAVPQVTVYKRGQFTFNRRFFETKFAGFLRVVPAEPEKDMVLQIHSTRGDHVGSRIARIMPSELHLQITKNGASSEVIIPFVEISEITVRHKDTLPAQPT